VFGAAGQPLWTAHAPEDGFFYSAVFSRDGNWLAAPNWAPSRRIATASTHRVGLWDVRTGKRVRSWDLDAAARVTSVALSPDGSRLAVVSGEKAVAGKPRQVSVYEAATGKRLYTLPAPPRGFRAAAFSADGRALATGGMDGAVCVWEAATGRLRQRFPGHTGEVSTLSFSPDGRLLVSACYSGDPIPLVWELTGR
jgi:WD40 repeat protein